MNNHRFSYIAHSNLKICNPIGSTKLNQLIDVLNLTKSSIGIDFGAGKSEFSIRLIEKYGLKMDSIDISEHFITEAENLAKSRIDLSRLNIINCDALTYLSDQNKKYDIAACIGSTHAFNDYKSSLLAIKDCVKPGGLLVLGEGYWKNKPSKEFLNFLGTTEDQMGSHHDNIKIAEEFDLVPLWSAVANQDEWDQYEWTYSKGIEDYVFNNPDDPESNSYLERIRNWRQATLNWGRDTFGFGLYLFRNGQQKSSNS